MATARAESWNTPVESRVLSGATSLYVRDVGCGRPMIVVHGGPEFDHSYLLPGLDELKDAFRLTYYDHRGRGRSADGVRPEDVTLASDLDDLDAIRRSRRLEAAAILGHSWGCVLALEYAVRHPARVSHLILMNPSPVSAGDFAPRTTYLEAFDGEGQRKIMSGPAYKSGDPEAVAARYRIHFKPTLKRREDYETLMARMEVAFNGQGSAGIVKARAVGDRLTRETWEAAMICFPVCVT